MPRIYSSREWKANSLCYVVPVPLVPVTRQAARVLRQVKLHRKEPGILSVLVSDIPQTDWSRRTREPHRCWQCEFPRTTLFIIIRASSVCSAWCSIVRIAWHLHDQLGVEIDRILQPIPAVAAKYVDTHCAYVSSALGMHCQYPSSLVLDWVGQSPRSCKLNSFEARAVHCKRLDLELVFAIQRIFEQCGIGAGSLGAAKQSVWSFLGGAYHSAGLSLKMMEQVLRSNVVRNVPYYRHGMALSIQWPHQQRTFAQVISESLRQRKGLRVANWFFYWPRSDGDACLQVFGTPEAIESALEYWRAIRSNGCPSMIVIFEAHDKKEDKPINGLLPWELFFRRLDRDDFIDDAVRNGAGFREEHDDSEARIQMMRQSIMENRFIVFWGEASVSIMGELAAVLGFLRIVAGPHVDEDYARGYADFRNDMAELDSLRLTEARQRATIASLRQENGRMALENQRLARENHRMARVAADLQFELREQQWYRGDQRANAWSGGRW